MAETGVSAVHRAFSSLLTTLTQQQLQSFMHDMSVAVATVGGSNQAITAAPAAKNNPNASQSRSVAKTMPSANNPIRPKRSRDNGKLRPLNSFMAFRSFYSSVFPDLSQKIRSGLLRLLWSSDPFKAKWAILAKAYSIVRDKHVGQVSLDTFLALNVPFIGIVAPTDYLRVMGLQVAAGEDKQYSLIRELNVPSLTQGDLTTNLSVDDVVNHCYQAGYVVKGLTSEVESDEGAVLSMAVSAQPNSVPVERGITRTTGSENNRHPQGAFPTPQFTVNVSGYRPAVNTAFSSTPQPGQSTQNTLVQTSNNLYADIPYTPIDFEDDLRNAVNAYRTQFGPGGYDSGAYNHHTVFSELDPCDASDYIDI